MFWPYAAWTKATLDAWALGMESSAVMGLRVAKLAAGGAAGEREARLMVAEKVQAAMELQAALFTGGLGTTALSGTTHALRHYRRKVKANRRRLG